MTRWLAILVVASMTLGACQEEVISQGSSIDRQFGQLNKNGWAVSSGGAADHASPLNDPNVRVVKQADFSGYAFHTNLQTDDPRVQRPNGQTQPAAAPQHSSTPPPPLPFGTALPGQ